MNIDLFQPVECPKCGGDGIFREKPCALCGAAGHLFRKVGAGLVMGLDAKADPAATSSMVIIPNFPHSPDSKVDTCVEVRRTEYAIQ